MAEENENEVAPLPAAKVEEMLEAGEAELVDVRREHEWDAGRIPGARHVQLDQLPEAAAELESGKPLIIYCHGGSRSAMAAEALRGDGVDAHSLEGGIDAWVKDGRALEPADGHVAESGEAAEILKQRGSYVPFPDDAGEPVESDS